MKTYFIEWRSKNVGPVFIFSRFLHENTHVIQYLEHVSNLKVSKSENYRNKRVLLLCVNDLPEKRVEDDRDPLRVQADASTLNGGRTVTENHSLARIRDSHRRLTLFGNPAGWETKSLRITWSGRDGKKYQREWAEPGTVMIPNFTHKYTFYINKL